MSSSHRGHAAPDRDDYDPSAPRRGGGGAHRRRGDGEEQAPPDRGYPPRRDGDYAQRQDDDYYSAQTRDYPQRRQDGYQPGQDDRYRPAPRDYPPRRSDGYLPPPASDYSPRRPDGYAPRADDSYPSAPTRDYAPARDYPPPRPRDYERRPDDGYAPGQDDRYAPRRDDGRRDQAHRDQGSRGDGFWDDRRNNNGFWDDDRRDDGRRARRAAANLPPPPPPARDYPARPDEGYRPRREQQRPAPPEHQQPQGTRTPEPGSGSLVRSSGVMAVGTLASRVTGMIRTFVLIAAIGTLTLGNAYNYANGLPNTVYNLAIGGVLTAVIVPLLVNASKRDADGGAEYDQRMFTLVTLVLGAITIVATIAAAPIAILYDLQATGNERHLLVIFAFFFIPQIFFYGVSSLAGAILNARGHFSAPAWTPVINNIVVIAVAVAFMVIAGVNASVANGNISTAEVWFLGIGTTVGIIAQTLALIPALRKVGFRWRPRFDFRRYELSEIGRMSGWMFGYVLTTQVAFWVTAAVSSTADKWALQHNYQVGIGYSAYTNAWLLFQLPYAIVAISVITALLPRMSANAADRRYDLVRGDFSAGVRLGSVIVAPAALVLAVLGPALAVTLLSWGSTSARSAAYLGLVFSVFSLGLMPYMLFQLLLRVFYALHDSRTPALIGLLTMTVNIGTNLVALLIFPKTQVVAALGAGFGLANLAGTLVAWRVLSRRLRGLGGRQIGGSLLRMHVAALPATLFALAVAVSATAALSTPDETHVRAAVIDALIVIVGGAGALGLYFAMAKIMRVTELTELVRSVRSRLGSARS
jgi:putative peptidoglycan lipid II flippase